MQSFVLLPVSPDGVDGFHGAWLHFLRARVRVCVWFAHTRSTFAWSTPTWSTLTRSTFHEINHSEINFYEINSYEINSQNLRRMHNKLNKSTCTNLIKPSLILNSSQVFFETYVSSIKAIKKTLYPFLLFPKVTGTSSWIKLLCQKLACITFPT